MRRYNDRQRYGLGHASGDGDPGFGLPRETGEAAAAFYTPHQRSDTPEWRGGGRRRVKTMSLWDVVRRHVICYSLADLDTNRKVIVFLFASTYRRGKQASR